jgi:hypothetical protein
MLGHSIVSQHFMEPVDSVPNSQELSPVPILNIRLYKAIMLPVVLYRCEIGL